MSKMNEIFDFAKSNFTKTTHKELYPAILPSRPELSQSGKTVLITGGGDNLGYSIAHAFLLAKASTIIIVGRRLEVLNEAKAGLEQEAHATNTSTKIIAYACDLTDLTQVDGMWKELNDHLGIVVDVFVANAAKPPRPLPILEAGTADIWSQIETNVKGPLYMTEKFNSQPGDKPKFVVNVSSAVIHNYIHPAVAARPGTVLSKSSNNMLFQLIAMESPPERLQVISYQPGLLWNQYMESVGLPREEFGNSREVAAAFAVWAATNEAAFLHGRFVWASWDVEEMAAGDIRKQIDSDPYFLRSTIVPFKGGAFV